MFDVKTRHTQTCVEVQSSLYGLSVADVFSFVGSFSQVGRTVETTEKSHSYVSQTFYQLEQYSLHLSG